MGRIKWPNLWFEPINLWSVWNRVDRKNQVFSSPFPSIIGKIKQEEAKKKALEEQRREIFRKAKENR